MLRGMWLGVSVVGIVSSAGCGGIDPAKDCIDEFVQEYVLDISGDEIGNLCPGQDLTGPPAFPSGSVTIRVEYSAGELYKMQTMRHWVGSNSGSADCTSVRLEEIVIRSRGSAGRAEIVPTIDGKVVTEAEVGGSGMLRYMIMAYDRKSLPTPKRHRVAKSSLESSKFDIDCYPESGNGVPYQNGFVQGKACFPVSPNDQCPAFDKMLPIWHSVGQQVAPVGRTTKFEYGTVGSVVDKSTWVMPK